MSFDVLQEKIIALKNPTVAGLDPKPEYVPAHIRRASYNEFGENLVGAVDAIFQFNNRLQRHAFVVTLANVTNQPFSVVVVVNLFNT